MIELAIASLVVSPHFNNCRLRLPFTYNFKNQIFPFSAKLQSHLHSKSTDYKVNLYECALAVCWDDDCRIPICSKFSQWDRKLFTLETKLEVEIQWTFYFGTSTFNLSLLDQKGILWLFSYASSSTPHLTCNKVSRQSFKLA